MHWLAPRLAKFAGLHPEVTVNLSTRLKPFDFTDSAFDAAIHYGRQDWPGTEAMKLTDEEILAVASPVIPPLHAAAEVLSLPLLQLESRPGDWGRWLAHHGQPNLRPPAMLFDQFATMQQAAIHGMGAALLPLFLIERDLAEGRLVPLFGPPIRALGSYYLVWDKARSRRAPLASFIDWLGSELRQAPALDNPGATQQS
jgi:DNA-binding transcriptional LysR family regulator